MCKRVSVCKTFPPPGFQNLENEISSREALTKAVMGTGRKLVRGNHFASKEIDEWLHQLEVAVETLKAEAERRRTRLTQACEVQQFLTEVTLPNTRVLYTSTLSPDIFKNLPKEYSS